MQDIKLLSHQLDDKIYDLADKSAPAVLARLSIRSHSGSARLPDSEDVPPNQNHPRSKYSGTAIDRVPALNRMLCPLQRMPVPAPNAPPNSLPFPTAFPPSPAVFPPAPSACTPGSFTPFPGNFGFIPGPSASRALPPAPGISHGPGNVPPLGAWDPALAHAAPFASASYLSPCRIT